MATHVIRKVVDKGVGFSAVDLNDVRHVFATAVPRRGSTLGQQADDALRTIEAVIEQEGTADSIVHQAVFLADVQPGGRVPADHPRLLRRRDARHELHPSAALRGQAAVDRGPGRRPRHGRSGDRARSASNWSSPGTTASPGSIVPRPFPSSKPAAFTTAASTPSSRCDRLFASVGVRFEQVIRTWLYLGGIVADEGPTQRYKELNRARTDFFQDIHFRVGRPPDGFHGSVFPASTGIGTEGRGIMMSAIALATERDDILAVPLENPRQTAAFDYRRPLQPEEPQVLPRPWRLSCGTYATIFISGTASITDSETRHVGDAAAQTDETLDNIAALISEENLSRHGLPGLGTALDSLGLVRVYIKRQEDYARVRAVCEKRLGEMPTIYAMADVCRPELLVEIEGIAFSHKASDSLSGDETPDAQQLPAHQPKAGHALHKSVRTRAGDKARMG